MNPLKRFSFKPVGHAIPALESRVDKLKIELGLLLPDQLAEQSGAYYLELGQGRGEFHLALLGTPIVVTYPDFHAFTINTDAHLPAFKHALVLYYFLHSDGTPPSGKRISFSDLPGGRIYSDAFQGYTGNELAKVFKMSIDQFCVACEKAGGSPNAFGDAAFYFRALPRMDLLVVYYLGDDDFSLNMQIAF
jgi:hypothetical protein